MPGYKVHMIGGAGFAILAGVIGFFIGVFRPEPEMMPYLLAVAVLGALFPDTDTDSKGQNLFYGTLVIIDLYLLYTGNYKLSAILGFCALFPALGHHRGWTHTWWASILVPAPIVILPNLFLEISIERLLPYYAAAFAGYLSHLVLDRKF